VEWDAIAGSGTSGKAGRGIDVFLADDNLIVREGVRALIERSTDLRVVGVAADYDGVLSGCSAAEPQVLVTDVRMPPSFRREGIDAAKEVRKMFPGTGVVILSQYDDPEYAVSLLAEGSAGYGYLLKDRVAEGTQLADAIRSVATGGTALDPQIVEALVRPVVSPGGLLPGEEQLLGMIAEGRTIKAIAAMRHVPATVVDAEVEEVFVKLAAGVSAGDRAALDRLRLLHQAIVDREEQGETLSRLLPSGLADKLRTTDLRIGETERVVVTVLMSDIRSYSTIAESADPAELAGQLNTHRAAMNQAILGEGGTVMQFVGDAVMAVFGAPFPQADHADRAVAAAAGMHRLQSSINDAWRPAGLPEFGLGIGLSTGPAAAALLGSAERLEYTLVGDTVNLAQRLQQFAAAGETVLSAATRDELVVTVQLTALPPQLVKGRQAPVSAFKVGGTGLAANSADSADAAGETRAAAADGGAAAAPAGVTGPVAVPAAASGDPPSASEPADPAGLPEQEPELPPPAAVTAPETAQITTRRKAWKIWKASRPL
jgi:class 3 adenylate cyclase/DNA-binding NarL/FixJ family response regulator